MKYARKTIAIAALTLLTAAASADIYTFDAGGNTVGTLEITDMSGGAFFSLTSSTSASFDSSAFLLDLSFQGPNGTFGNYTGPGSPAVATFATSTDAGQTYDWTINFDNAPPADRLLSGMTATWTITGTGLTADSFAMPMQLHIGSVNGMDDSIKIPAIPEPETYALMLAGLGVLVLLGRLRSNRRES